MAITHKHDAVLLSRLLALKDYSPFILVQDSFAQSADYFILEFLHRIPESANAIYLSFESKAPKRMNKTIQCGYKSPTQIQTELKSSISTDTSNLVIIDTLAYVPTEQLTKFLVPMIGKKTSVVAIAHSEFDTKSKTPYFPSALTLLSYFATATITVSPQATDIHTQEDREKEMDNFLIPTGCNKNKFQVQLANRRRSGRNIIVDYAINYSKHSIDYLPPKKEEEPMDENDEEALKGLTTFNLQTTDKQKQQKENVDLPFYHAQEFGDGGAQGGAIIYEFEKDDDYDEEDPYEDPF